MKSKGLAYLLWLLSGFGWLGVHRFYLGKYGTGLLWMVTGGLFGFGLVYDFFTLGNKVDIYNTNHELKTIRTSTSAYIQTQATREGIGAEDKRRKDFDEPMDDVLDA